MKKRFVLISVIVLVLVLALFLLSACDQGRTEVGVELVLNGDLASTSSGENGTIVDNWTIGGEWDEDLDSPYSYQRLDSESSLYEEHGTGYVILETGDSGWVYLSQGFAVDRRAVYQVSFDARLVSYENGDTDESRGAFVTFLENVEFIMSEQTSAGEWKSYTVYVRPINTDYLTIALSLGAEGAECDGVAYFDNISVTRVDESALAAGTTIHDFRMSQIARYNRDLSGTLFVTFLTIFGFAAVVAAYVIVKKLYARNDVFVNFDGTPTGSYFTPASGKTAGKGGAKAAKTVAPVAWWKNAWFIAAMLMLGAFVLRLVFLLSMYGFGDEMTATVNLAKWLGANGVGNIYANASEWSNVDIATMSPGTVYILAILGAMGQNLTSDALSVLIRMVGVLGDMAVVGMIYFYGRKYAGDKSAVVFAALYAVLPVALVMSGMTNTFTSLLVALMVAAVILLVEKKFVPMYIVMALAAMLDIRALALAPIAVTYLGYTYYRADSSLKTFGKTRATIVFGLVGAFVLVYVLTLPVAINHLGENAFYGMRAIANQMLNNNIFVDNAFGFYAMATLNQKGFNNTASILNLVFILVLVVYICSLYFKKRNRHEVILLASYTLAMVAVFTLKVNWTYLFLSIALGVIYAMVAGEKRVCGVMGAYSLLAFLCLGLIVKNSGYAAITGGGYIVDFETTGADFILFSVITVLVTLYYSYVVYNITNTGKIADIKPLNKPLGTAIKDSFRSFTDVFKKD